MIKFQQVKLISEFTRLLLLFFCKDKWRWIVLSNLRWHHWINSTWTNQWLFLPPSCAALFFLLLVSAAATAVLSFKPSAIKQQKIPYPISSRLQLSASVIPLLCSGLGELPLPPVWTCSAWGMSPCPRRAGFSRGGGRWGDVASLWRGERGWSGFDISPWAGFDARLLYISISPSLALFSSVLCVSPAPSRRLSASLQAHIKPQSFSSLWKSLSQNNDSAFPTFEFVLLLSLK